MIVNALCTADEPSATIFSGGYDCVVKRWDVETKKCTASVTIDAVVNALATGNSGTVYVGDALGYIHRLDSA